MVDELQPYSVFLNVENGEGENYEAYPFFGDQRFTGTWCGNFSKEDDLLFFSDMKTGLHFRGKLLKENIQLEILVADTPISKILLEKSQEEWDFQDAETKTNRQYVKPLSLIHI